MQDRITSPMLHRAMLAPLGEQRVGAFSRLPSMVRERGGDPAAVLREVGIEATDLDHPDKRIPYAVHGRLLHVAAQHTSCPHFGLVFGQAWHLADLGVVGEIARNGATVGDALRALVVHQRLNSGGGLAYLIDYERTADFGYAIYHHGVVGSDQIYGAILAAGCNYLSELAGGGCPVETVLFPFARPAHADAFRRVFRCSVSFDNDRAALRFRSDWLARPVAGASAARRRALEDEVLKSGPGDFIERVVRSLRTLLIAGRHSGDDVAQMLALHRRTLNRRLKAQGTSFQQLLDSVRFEVACELLANGTLPMDEIAMSLGYSGLAAFQRTFRRWSGETPARWRRAQRSVEVAGARAAD